MRTHSKHKHAVSMSSTMVSMRDLLKGTKRSELSDFQIEEEDAMNDENETSSKEYTKPQKKEDKAKILAGGDFQVQVHVIEARNLSGKDIGGTSDPMVTVTIFDEKKSTKIESKTKNPRWNEILYFELNKLERDQLSHGKALISVLDDDIFINDLIGLYEFDLSWIYYREHHEVYNQWVALTNPNTEDHGQDQKGSNGIDGIEGYLKLSITVLGPGDEQYIHDEDEEFAIESSLE